MYNTLICTSQNNSTDRHKQIQEQVGERQAEEAKRLNFVEIKWARFFRSRICEGCTFLQHISKGLIIIFRLGTVRNYIILKYGWGEGVRTNLQNTCYVSVDSTLKVCDLQPLSAVKNVQILWRMNSSRCKSATQGSGSSVQGAA